MPITRDVVRPHAKPASQRSGTTINIGFLPSPSRTTARASARDAVASFMAKAQEVTRKIEACGDAMARTRDGLARLQPLADARKAARDAEARYAAQAARCSPAALNAANRARWARP